MGGITVIIYENNNSNITNDFIKSFMNIKCRGPNDSSYTTLTTVDINQLNTHEYDLMTRNLSKNDIRVYRQYTFILCYHRLCINDTSYNGSQPFEDPIITKLGKYKDLSIRPKRQLLCNGEIYNYAELIGTNNFDDHDLQSTCDVEIILPMYIKYGLSEMLNQLNGDYAFVLTENINTYKLNTVNVYAARDFLGIKPLYIVKNAELNFIMFISEIKALPFHIIKNPSYYIEQIPPGCYWSFANNNFTTFYDLSQFSDVANCQITSTSPDSLMSIYFNINSILTESIVSRYTSTDKPIGILLSGGFDSCIITSILIEYMINTQHYNFDINKNNFEIFTIGDNLNSEIDLDVSYAKRFVQFLEDKYSIDIVHHIVYVNEIEILASDIEKIIYHLETYEPETIRESIPYYYLFKYIYANTNVKVLLSGDGVDELCGYHNFNDLDDILFQQKSVDLLKNMCKYDLLRSDRLSNTFSLEVRFPFLDKVFIEYILNLHPKLKRQGYYSNEHLPVNKYIIRKSFESTINNGITLLEHDILWRSHNCICESLTNFELRLNNFLNESMTTIDFNNSLTNLLSEQNINSNTLPKTKQEMYYRLIFRKFYPNRDYLIKKFWDDLW